MGRYLAKAKGESLKLPETVRCPGVDRSQWGSSFPGRALLTGDWGGGWESLGQVAGLHGATWKDEFETPLKYFVGLLR